MLPATFFKFLVGFVRIFKTASWVQQLCVNISVNIYLGSLCTSNFMDPVSINIYQLCDVYYELCIKGQDFIHHFDRKIEEII